MLVTISERYGISELPVSILENLSVLENNPRGEAYQKKRFCSCIYDFLPHIKQSFSFASPEETAALVVSSETA